MSSVNFYILVIFSHYEMTNMPEKYLQKITGIGEISARLFSGSYPHFDRFIRILCKFRDEIKSYPHRKKTGCKVRVLDVVI
jgi:hypothetical protein